MLMTIAVLLCSATVHAHDIEVDGIYYRVVSSSDLTVAVTYKGNSVDEFSNEYSGEIIIPSTVTYKSKVLTVTEIGGGAFEDCDITSISIPGSVISIGNGAFNDCGELTKVRFEDGTETLSLGYNYNGSYYGRVGEGLFYDCPLGSIYLGRDLNYITKNEYGYSPFYKMEKLKSLTVSNCVTSIGDYAFYGCSSLTSITIPESVTTIGISAFHGCSSLTSITIPEGVTTIGDYAFSNCKSLTSITIPNSTYSIGSYAFEGCNALEKLNLNSSHIGDWFKNNTSIKTVILGDCVKKINNYAFTNCIGLTNITMGNSVEFIGIEAFSGCTELTNIYLFATTPPKVSLSSFTDSHYVKTSIYVPQGSLATYQSADTWEEFWDIQEFEATAIKNMADNTLAFVITSEGIKFTAAEGKTVAIYTASGTVVEKINSYACEKITLDNGTYIIHVGDKTMKVKL